MSYKKFISDNTLSEAEYINKYLPADHNEQDVVYLKARFAFLSTKGHDEVKAEIAHKAYQGTTFQKKG